MSNQLLRSAVWGQTKKHVCNPLCVQIRVHFQSKGDCFFSSLFAFGVLRARNMSDKMLVESEINAASDDELETFAREVFKKTLEKWHKT